MALLQPEKGYRSRKEIVDDPESPEMYEVVAGELYLPRDFGVLHAHTKAELFMALLQHVGPKRLGRILLGPLDVVVDEDQSVQPDIIFVSIERRHIITDFVYGPPDLVVEVIAPNTSARDKVLKTRLYAKFGIPHYWIVDPSDRTLIAFELTGNRYTVIASAAGDETFEPSLFPGLTIELSEIWA